MMVRLEYNCEQMDVHTIDTPISYYLFDTRQLSMH